MTKLLLCFTLLFALLSPTALAADGKRSIGAACLPEYSSDGERIGRVKGGILKNTSSSKITHVVCPLLNDVISPSTTRVKVGFKGKLYCIVYSYDKNGKEWDHDNETIDAGSSIREMTLEIEETDGQMELYCHLYGGAELIYYDWKEDA